MQDLELIKALLKTYLWVQYQIQIDSYGGKATPIKVENLGFYNPSLGARAGWNIRIYIEGYDSGSGISKYQTWLVPYQNGSGAEREDGNNRLLTNVLYLDKPEGRTFCAYAIDKAGNEAEKCATIKIQFYVILYKDMVIL